MYLLSRKRIMKAKSTKGFTLVELVAVVVILGLMISVGGRYVQFAVDAKKYNETVAKLVTIRNAIVGDDRLVVLGNRADMGYFENNYSFPAAGAGNTVPTVTLRDFLPPVPELETAAQASTYQVDAWGTPIFYDDSVQITFGAGATASNYFYVRIMSLGANGTNVVTGDALDEDLEILIRRDHYLDNMVKSNVMDSNGTIMRGYPNRAALTPAGNHQIRIVRLENAAGATQFGTDQAGASRLYYFQGLFSSQDDVDGNPLNWTSNSVPAGFYRMHVWPTNGASGADARGSIDHRNDLSGSNADLAQVVVVYPKDPEAVNFLEFRLPGAVDADEL